MAENNNVILLKQLTPFLLNGLLAFIIYLLSTQQNSNPYGLAVYMLAVIVAGLVINSVFFFLFILNKDYKTAAIHALVIAAIIIFLIRL
jgi:lipopolysaccharide export LptBFGC system permease protein LptF